MNYHTKSYPKVQGSWAVQKKVQVLGGQEQQVRLTTSFQCCVLLETATKQLHTLLKLSVLSTKWKFRMIQCTGALQKLDGSHWTTFNTSLPESTIGVRSIPPKMDQCRVGYSNVFRLMQNYSVCKSHEKGQEQYGDMYNAL